MTITLLTAPMALRRWAIKTTMPPRARTACERSVERSVAVAVKVGVRLVEHDDERIAVKRASKADALALAGRELQPAVANPCVVALLELEDHVMDVGELCGSHDSLVGAARLEPGDIVRDRAVEQVDILRQVADGRATILG